MAQPTTYNRQYNFQNFQAASPSTPLPADRVDAEYNAVKVTLDQVLANLELIQNDDGTVKNESIGLDQLSPEVTVGFTVPTKWVTATAYVASPASTVFNGVKFYRCLVSHTSGTFATDLAAAKWALVADFTPFANSASTVIYDPSGTSLSATTVQAAIDELATEKLDLVGGTMTGVLSMGSHKITNLTDPTAAQDAATKNYVTEQVDDRFRYLFPEDFIADEGDETLGVQAFFDYLSINGGIGFMSRWYEIETSILVNTGSEPFAVLGVGKYICGLRRATNFVLSVLRITRDDFSLKSFGIDGTRSIVGDAGDHGLRLEGDRWSVEDIYVTNYVSTGIIGTGSVTHEDNMVLNCHVDGFGEAGNGISLVLNDNSGISGCFVENVHDSTPCIGLQLKGCTNSYIRDSQARNCFIGAATQNSDTAFAGGNNRLDNLIISEPNPNATVGLISIGVRLAAGDSLSVEGVSIDGEDLDDFIAMQVGNDPAGGAHVSFRASNCEGASSYALQIGGDTSYSMVTINSVFDVNDQFISLASGALQNTVLIGRVEGTRVLAPWNHVDDASGQLSNIVKLLMGDYSRRFVLADDEMAHITVDDADFGRLEVISNAEDESFNGTIRVSAAPFIEGDAGADVEINNTGPLTSGAGDGVDGKVNIYVQEDEIYLKNRMGAQRTLLLRLIMA